ncbi:MAG: hypothetical protein ABIN73_05325 [candidate division WOR-3 bacterium]
MELYKIPEKSGEFIIKPLNTEEILKLCEENRKKREKFKKFFDFEIKGNFTVTSSHQTVFYHPGIWIKPLFMTELKKRGINSKFYENDIDGTDRIFFYYPDKEFKIKREFLFYSPFKIALEYIESKEIEKNKSLIEKVIEKLPENLKIRAEKFFQIFFKNLEIKNFFSEAFSTSRIQFEQEALYENFFLSDILTSKEFFSFFSYFFINAEKVYECYNEAIIEYRKKFNIKNKTEPALLLEKKDDIIELPFFLNLKERFRVFKKKDNLYTEKFEIYLGREKEEVLFNSITLPIRPRSLILSMYYKIFESDLFYHGISGKNYDIATDIFIEKLFGISPPVTGVISLTLFLENIERRDFPFFFFDKGGILDLINSTFS